MIRVALLGSGAMGQTHARAYATLPDVRVVAVVDHDGASASTVAAPLGARAYTTLTDALDAARPDVVDCCWPTPLHRTAVERAASHGSHVICEKPLALTLDDGHAMIAACRAAGTRLLVAQVVRFFPAYRALADHIHDGRIGQPVLCTLLRQGFYPTGRAGWYRDEARSGGVFLDLMIHDFDWALWQFGPAERVYARFVAASGDEARPYAQGMATVRHRSGVISGVTGTWGYPGPFTTAVEIAGTGGLLRYHTDESRPLRLLAPVKATHDNDVPLPDIAGGDDPYRVELAHFVDVLHGRVEPLVRPEEALATLRLALAARASAATNEVELIGKEESA